MTKTTCTVIECQRSIVAQVLGDAHYLRMSIHGDVLAHVPIIERVVDHEDGSRTCLSCAVRQPILNFNQDKSAKRGRRAQCKGCRSASMKTWYADNQDRQMKRARVRFVQDIDKIRLNDTARYNRDKVKRTEIAVESMHRRRARLAGATVDHGITRTALRKIYGDDCRYCGITMSFKPVKNGGYNPIRATLEHVLPISRGGAHSWDNTALACWQCNVRKNRKTVQEWLQPESDTATRPPESSPLPLAS